MQLKKDDALRPLGQQFFVSNQWRTFISLENTDRRRSPVDDMPYGCIYDKTNVKHHHVFWNQAGVAISADKNVREICQEIEDPFEGLDCLKDYRKIRGPDSCQVKPHSKR